MNHKKKNKELIKNTVILGIGQFVPKIISLISLPILTTYLTTGEYGIYDLIISFSSLIMPIMSLLVQQGLFRYLITEKDEENKNGLITTAILFIVVNSSFLFIFAFITCIIFDLNLKFYLFIFLLYFLETVYDLFGQVSRGLNKNNVYSYGAIIYSIMNAILLIILLKKFNINIYTALFVVIISYFISSIFIIIKTKIYKKISLKRIDNNKLKKLLKYSIPIIPSSISLWIVNLSDRLLITFFLGNSINGIYAAACKIPNLMNSAYGVFNLAWTETAVKTYNEDDKNEYYSDLYSKLYRFLISIILFLIVLSPIIYKLLINKKFYNGFNQMPILFLAIFFSCLTSFFGGIYIAFEKTKKVGISSFVGAIINFFINILLIKKIGIYAASISTLISFASIFIYRVYDTKKYINIKYNYKDIIISVVLLIIIICIYYIKSSMLIYIGFPLSVLYFVKYNFLYEIIINKIKGVKNEKI